MNVSIYIMQSGDCQKVGFASDARKRKSQMQTGNPDFVSIHFVTAAISKSEARQIERRAHQLLSGFRERGEWFRCGLLEAYDAVRQAVTEWRFHLGLKSEADIDHFFGFERIGPA